MKVYALAAAAGFFIVTPAVVFTALYFGLYHPTDA